MLSSRQRLFNHQQGVVSKAARRWADQQTVWFADDRTSVLICEPVKGAAHSLSENSLRSPLTGWEILPLPYHAIDLPVKLRYIDTIATDGGFNRVFLHQPGTLQRSLCSSFPKRKTSLTAGNLHHYRQEEKPSHFENDRAFGRDWLD